MRHTKACAPFEAESFLTAARYDRPGGHLTVGDPFHRGENDHIDRLVEWYSHERTHMSLN